MFTEGYCWRGMSAPIMCVFLHALLYNTTNCTEQYKLDHPPSNPFLLLQANRLIGGWAMLEVAPHISSWGSSSSPLQGHMGKRLNHVLEDRHIGPRLCGILYRNHCHEIEQGLSQGKLHGFEEERGDARGFGGSFVLLLLSVQVL